MMQESRVVHIERAPWSTLVFVNPLLGETEAHLGRYAQARVAAQESLAHAHKPYFQEVGRVCRVVLGLAALGEEAYAEAEQSLQRSVTGFRKGEHHEGLGWSLAVLGFAKRALDRPSQARQCLSEAFGVATALGAFMPLIYGLPLAALLLADAGEDERAVEVYGLASRHGYVANSRWFEDVAGRRISDVAASLPPGVVAAAQGRGRARDLEATAAELLAELEA
jgi:hypothetical protein